MVRSGGAMTSPEKLLFASSIWLAVVVYRGLIWTRARVLTLRVIAAAPASPAVEWWTSTARSRSLSSKVASWMRRSAPSAIEEIRASIGLVSPV